MRVREGLHKSRLAVLLVAVASRTIGFSRLSTKQLRPFIVPTLHLLHQRS